MAIRTFCLAVLLLLAPALVVADERSAAEATRIDAEIKRLTERIDRLQDQLLELGVKPASLYQTRVYDLADLVVVSKQDRGLSFDGDAWVALIERSIPTATWKSRGGEGTIAPFLTNLSVVVSQTPDVHEKIAKYLADMRELKERLENAGLHVELTPTSK